MANQYRKLRNAWQSHQLVYIIRHGRLHKCRVSKIDVYAGTTPGESPHYYIDLVLFTDSRVHFPIEDITDILFEEPYQ